MAVPEKMEIMMAIWYLGGHGRHGRRQGRLNGLAQVRPRRLVQQRPLGQALEEGLLTRADSFVEGADADDVGAEAVAEDHASDGNGVLGVHQVGPAQDQADEEQ